MPQFDPITHEINARLREIDKKLKEGKISQKEANELRKEVAIADSYATQAMASIVLFSIGTIIGTASTLIIGAMEYVPRILKKYFDWQRKSIDKHYDETEQSLRTK